MTKSTLQAINPATARVTLTEQRSAAPLVIPSTHPLYTSEKLALRPFQVRRNKKRTAQNRLDSVIAPRTAGRIAIIIPRGPLAAGSHACARGTASPSSDDRVRISSFYPHHPKHTSYYKHREPLGHRAASAAVHPVCKYGPYAKRSRDKFKKTPWGESRGVARVIF